jgi:hypothetical protein
VGVDGIALSADATVVRVDDLETAKRELLDALQRGDVSASASLLRMIF